MLHLSRGIGYALGAAVLFGASTPFAKLLLGEVSPLVLAAILYLGSGLGLASWVILRGGFGARTPAAPLALGVWLHLSERHEHRHAHEAMEHDHEHVHDAHHQHQHDSTWDGREPHVHRHRHEALVHSHPHYPDLHHRHEH